MKATIVLSTLILFAVLMGCSDNSTLFGPKDQNQINGSVSQTKGPGPVEPMILWEKAELKVEATIQFLAENKCSYSNPPLTENESYKIEFDVYTDANKFTNGYVPTVKVSADKECVFQSSAFPGADGTEITHVEFELTNTRFNNINFNIALMQAENLPVIQNNGDVTTLKLSNLAIYRIN